MTIYGPGYDPALQFTEAQSQTHTTEQVQMETVFRIRRLRHNLYGKWSLFNNASHKTTTQLGPNSSNE